MHRHKLNLSATSWIGAALLAAGLPASAEETIDGTLPIMEEITVTTRRRAENLQEVPIAVDVYSQDFIREFNIRNLQDVVKFSSSLQFDKSFSQNSIRVAIRGLTNTRGRANVAFLVDGIDVTSETTGNNAGSPLLVNQRLLADVERIEAVKGPQSALYGRAAFAGAISYITAEPGETFEGNIGLDFADYSSFEVNGGVSIPLGDRAGLRLTGVTWETDGYFNNVTSGEAFGGGDGYGVAGTAVWRPTDNLKFKARLSWSDEAYEPGAVASLRSREILVPVPEDASAVTRETEVPLVRNVGENEGLEVRSSEDPLSGSDYPGNVLEVFRATLIANWNVGSVTLSSYTGLTDADLSQRYDLDRQAIGNPDTLLGNGEVDSFGNTKQVSQEFRAASNWDSSPVQLTLGGLYWEEERDDFARNIASVCWISSDCFNAGLTGWQDLYEIIFANSSDFRDPKFVKTEHWSIYGMLEWAITDGWTLTLEDRYVEEDFTADVFQASSCVVPFALSSPTCVPGEPLNGKTESDYHTPKLTLDWRPIDEVLLYTSIGKGQKPAGVSLLQLPVPIAFPLEVFLFEPEQMWAYEFGAKTNWQGNFGALTLNGAIFYQNYSDKQTNTQQELEGGVIIGVVTNASAAKVAGFELETSWVTPVDGLTLSLAYTYLDSEYSDFRDPTRSASRIAIAGTCGREVEIGGRAHCELDLSGNELEFAPRHSMVHVGDFTRPIAGQGISAFFGWNVLYQDERFTSADNFRILDAYWQLDLRAGLRGDQWTFMAYVDNAFDDDTVTSSGGNVDLAEGYVDSFSVAPPGIPTAFLRPPRLFGVRVLYNF